MHRVPEPEAVLVLGTAGLREEHVVGVPLLPALTAGWCLNQVGARESPHGCRRGECVPSPRCGPWALVYIKVAGVGRGFGARRVQTCRGCASCSPPRRWRATCSPRSRSRGRSRPPATRWRSRRPGGQRPSRAPRAGRVFAASRRACPTRRPAASFGARFRAARRAAAGARSAACSSRRASGGSSSRRGCRSSSGWSGGVAPALVVHDLAELAGPLAAAAAGDPLRSESRFLRPAVPRDLLEAGTEAAAPQWRARGLRAASARRQPLRRHLPAGPPATGRASRASRAAAAPGRAAPARPGRLAALVSRPSRRLRQSRRRSWNRQPDVFRTVLEGLAQIRLELLVNSSAPTTIRSCSARSRRTSMWSSSCRRRRCCQRWTWS